MTLVRIVKDWDYPNLMRQTPDQKGIWGEIKFTLDPIETCDVLVLLNTRMKMETRAICPRENIWAIIQEPYMKGFNDWIVEKHEHISKVFTNYLPREDIKYISSHPALPWHVNKTFDELLSLPVPKKTKTISWIVGNAMDLPGHFKRLSFLKFIQQVDNFEIDLFGRAVKDIEDKWDGLFPYQYSLAIENSEGPDYWTEKIADCFLTWTVPIYFGCTNLENYFPEESFIRIDINQPKASVEKIRNILNEDKWERRLSALEKARNLVLHQYQLFPYISKLIDTYAVLGVLKKPIAIPGYKRSTKASLYHFVYKLKKILKLL